MQVRNNMNFHRSKEFELLKKYYKISGPIFYWGSKDQKSFKPEPTISPAFLFIPHAMSSLYLPPTHTRQTHTHTHTHTPDIYSHTKCIAGPKGKSKGISGNRLVCEGDTSESQKSENRRMIETYLKFSSCLFFIIFKNSVFISYQLDIKIKKKINFHMSKSKLSRLSVWFLNKSKLRFSIKFF